MQKDIKQRIEQIKNGEIPKGYKHSKVGIIPENWEVIRLKDKFDRLSRKNSESNTNVLTISAQYGLINQEEFFKKEIASDDKSNYYLLHRGEFAYNKSYSNGYPFGAIKRLSRYDKGVVSPLYICFSANSSNACPEYYEQYFEAGRLNHEIQAYAQEGARNHGLLNISVSDFFNSFILMPPIKEQKRIANILSAQDKVIECYEKKIEQLKRMKKYYLQNMFPKHGESVPKIRFKGFTDPWEQRKLSDLIEENLKPIPKPDKEYVRLGIRSHAKGTFHEVVAKGAGLDVDTMYVVEADNLIVNITFAWEEAWAITSEEDAEKLVSHRFPQYRFHQGQYPMFYQYRFRNGRMKYNLELASPGGAGRNRVLNKTEFLKIPVIIPTSYKEEKQIGEYFQSLDDLITLHQNKLEKEKKKKKALQQLLLTGIVRV